MNDILCSTGSLIGRPNGRDFRLLEYFCPRLNCDGFEFIFYNSWYDRIDEIRTFLKRLKLNIPVMHCEKTIGELWAEGGEENWNEAKRRLTVNCELARDIGSRKLVIHLWNGVISDTRFENNLAAYPLIRETAERCGLDPLIENVICRTDPMSRWTELKQHYPDIHFVFDTKMADFHRQVDCLYRSENDWLWKENHLRHFHVNDYGGGYMDFSNLKVLPIGKGHIDFDRFFAFIRKIGYHDTFTFESTGFNQEGQVDLDMLNEQYETARRYLASNTPDNTAYEEEAP